MNICFHIGILTVAVALSSCGPLEDIAVDLGEIEQTMVTFEAAVDSGNVDLIMSHYFDAVSILPPEGGMIEGKPAIRARFESFFNANDADLSYEIKALRATGALAFVRATYAESYVPKNGDEAQVDSGNWVLVFEEDTPGAWKIIFETWTQE